MIIAIYHSKFERINQVIIFGGDFKHGNTLYSNDYHYNTVSLMDALDWFKD